MNSAQFTNMETFLFYSNGMEELGCATALLLLYNRAQLHMMSYVKAVSELETTICTSQHTPQSYLDQRSPREKTGGQLSP